MSRILKLFKKKKVLLEGIIGIAYLISLAYDLYKGSFFLFYNCTRYSDTISPKFVCF